MIAGITYQCTGAETKGVSSTTIYIVPASGYTLIDVLLNGNSKEFGVGVEVDNETGQLVFPSLLGRGDWVLALFRQLPRFNASDEGGSGSEADNLFSDDEFSTEFL